VKNEFDDEFVTKQCYEFVVVSVLIAFLCMLTNSKVCVTFLGQWGSKSRFLGRFCVSSREEPKNLGSVYWCNPPGELLKTKPMILGIPGSWGRFQTPLSVSFDVFDCCFDLKTYWIINELD